MSKTPKPATWRDYLILAKPGIVRMCAITTAGGLYLAPGSSSWRVWVGALLGSSFLVAAANAMNMVHERVSDREMARTRKRPTVTGSIAPREGYIFAAACALLGSLLLGLWTTPVSLALGWFALVSYVWVYTPLKQRTPLALVIGAVPGAIPPLLGWSCATGRLDLPGLVLFGILLVWQMPHFIAIALYRKEDYRAAGIQTVPVVRGDRVAKIQAMAWAGLLLPVSLALTLLGVTGRLYLVVATLLGVIFLGWSATGLRSGADAVWARRFFLASLIYLPALMLALAIDVSLPL